MQLRHALDLDEAHAAGADRIAEPRLVAEDGNLDAGGERGLDEARALGDVHVLVVDDHADEVGHRAASRLPRGCNLVAEALQRLPESSVLTPGLFTG